MTLPGLRLSASASLPLASCWPRPQQLLPVSAAGGGRRRCSRRERHWRVGQAHAGRVKLNLYRKQQCPATKASSSLTRNMVPQLLPSVAGHYFLRYIRLPAASSELTGLPMALPLGATATTAASGGNREELLGQRPAGCKRQRSKRWVPQPGLGASAPERAPLSALRGIDGGVCFQCKVIAVAVALLVRPCKGYGLQSRCARS